MFNENSGLVKLWVKHVKDPESTYSKEDVPKLSNLQDVVYSVLDK